MGLRNVKWANNQIWVSPNDGDRAVKRVWNQRNSYVSSNKNDAVSKARDIARNDRWELFVQNRDWKIGSRSSYWRDPFPPRDRK